MLPRMRSFASLILVSALAIGLVACSDDDDEPSADTDESTDATGAPGPGEEFDPEVVTEQLEAAILGEEAESDWHVESVAGDEIVVAPNDGVEATEADANTVCGAIVTVAFNVLPTAVVTVTDGDGTPLITSEGAEGCHPVGE
jgi:hypothetical protein